MQYFEKQGNALIFRQDGETVRMEPWQKDSLRVRGTLLSEIEEGSIALLDPEPVEAEIELVDELKATIKNGKIQAVLELQRGTEAADYVPESEGRGAALRDRERRSALPARTRLPCIKGRRLSAESILRFQPG